MLLIERVISTLLVVDVFAQHAAVRCPLDMWPPGRQTQRFLKQFGCQTATQKLNEGLHDFPRSIGLQNKGRVTAYVPLHIIRFLKCASCLKDVRSVHACGTSFIQAYWPRRYREMLAQSAQEGCPPLGMITLRVGSVNLELVCLLLPRRRFGFQLQSIGHRSIHLTADSSPNTGHDVFGMLDTILCGGGAHDKWQLKLPGSTRLGHRFTEAIHKLMNLLWASGLLCGPCIATLHRSLMVVRSLVADMGPTENMMLNINDSAVQGFLESLGRKLSSHPAAELVFPHVVHLPDWCHMLSSCLKSSFEAMPRRPWLLEQLSTLLDFSTMECLLILWMCGWRPMGLSVASRYAR